MVDRLTNKRYQVIAVEVMEDMAIRMEQSYPTKFMYHKTKWNKFPDGTDRIEIGGFYPTNVIAGEHIIFLANFYNNDITLSQFQVMICLLQSFIESLIVVLCYSPVGTMERVVQEGQVATAATYAHMFSTLPSCGKPTRLIVYDLHTLQNRFYLHTNAVADLRTGIPLLKQRLNELQKHKQQEEEEQNDSIETGSSIESSKLKNRFIIAFPDDGAAKRFRVYFNNEYDIVVCGKTRVQQQVKQQQQPTDNSNSTCTSTSTTTDTGRVVTIQDGPSVVGRDVVIVDDLVQTGGTLYETGRILKDAGARTVHAYVSHAVFPNHAWKRFCSNNSIITSTSTSTSSSTASANNNHSTTTTNFCFTTFWVTNSIPTVTNELPKDNIFEVLDLMDLIVSDIDRF